MRIIMIIEKKLVFFTALGFAFWVICMKPENYLIDIQLVISEVPTTQKVISLTFDDGPHDKTTPDILAVLKSKNVKATFFIVGERTGKRPELVKQIALDGHEIGNHSYSHPNLTRLTAGKINEELAKSEELLHNITPHPFLFRPPGGQYNNTVMQIAKEKGYLIILWSVDPEDWTHRSAGKITDVVLKNIKPGGIILLHDGIYPSSTPEALGYIIDSLKDRGYEFVTVSSLLGYYQESHRQ